MIVRIKKYVAKVSRFVENAESGEIRKEISEIVLDGQRFGKNSVEKRIPREYSLISHGWIEKAYNVDPVILEKFLNENGTPVEE